MHGDRKPHWVHGLLLAPSSLDHRGRGAMGDLGNMGEGNGGKADSTPRCNDLWPGLARAGVDSGWSRLGPDLILATSIYRAAQRGYHRASCREARVP